MVERRPLLTVLTHVGLALGIFVIAFPLYVTFVASTLTLEQVLEVPMRLVPGDRFWANYSQVLTSGSTRGSGAPVGQMMWNSLVMALVIGMGVPLLYVAQSIAPPVRLARFLHIGARI